MGPWGKVMLRTWMDVEELGLARVKLIGFELKFKGAAKI